MFQVKALAGSVPSSASVPSPLNGDHVPGAEEVPSCGDRMVAVGGLPTLIDTGVESVVFTPSETVSRAVYWPGCVVRVARVRRRRRAAVAERPGVGERLPSGIRRAALEKLTASGAGPAVGFAAATRHRRPVAAQMKRIRRILLTPNVPLVSE